MFMSTVIDVRNKKILCHENGQSISAPHVYAVGDVLDGKLELTPVAIQAGRFLVARLFKASELLCDYTNVPTTIFTPLEYGCCGMSEEAALQKYESAAADKQQIVGMHLLSPNAGEIMQGFAMALKLSATAEDFRSLIGIHPTCAEVLVEIMTFSNLALKSTGFKSGDASKKEEGGC